MNCSLIARKNNLMRWQERESHIPLTNFYMHACNKERFTQLSSLHENFGLKKKRRIYMNLNSNS